MEAYFKWFPTVRSYTMSESYVWCARDEIIKHYNEHVLKYGMQKHAQQAVVVVAMAEIKVR